MNAELVGTENGDAAGHASVQNMPVVSAGVLLENEVHAKSDCTLFQADSGDVLSHMTAAPAALTVPQ